MRTGKLYDCNGGGELNLILIANVIVCVIFFHCL